MHEPKKGTLGPDWTLNLWHWILLAVFLAAVVADLCLPRSAAAWDGLVLVLAALSGAVALLRQLPLQNVVLATTITAVMGTLAQGIGAKTDIPFGPFTFGSGADPLLFHFTSWVTPFMWVAMVFSSRGVGRLILRPWRKARSYGFQLIGMTTLLTVLLDLALEPFAAKLRFLWCWQPTRLPVTWYGATPINFLAWAFVVLLILALITPPLIRKQPGSPSAPDWSPLLVWLGLVGLFAVSVARSGWWPAVFVDAGLAAVATLFAVRGARW